MIYNILIHLITCSLNQSIHREGHLLADLGLLMKGQAESEHGVGFAIEVDIVDGIQVKGDHMVEDREQ